MFKKQFMDRSKKGARKGLKEPLSGRAFYRGKRSDGIGIHSILVITVGSDSSCDSTNTRSVQDQITLPYKADPPQPWVQTALLVNYPDQWSRLWWLSTTMWRQPAPELAMARYARWWFAAGTQDFFLSLGVQNPYLLDRQIMVPNERCCVTCHHNSTTHFLSIKALQSSYPLTVIISLNIFDNLLNSMCPLLELSSDFWKFKRNRIKICIFLFSPKHCQSITFYYFTTKLHETARDDLW